MTDQQSLDATPNIEGSERPGATSARSPSPTSRDLLFGRLAVRNGLIEQDELDEAIKQQTTEPSKPLADILVALGALSEQSREAIDGMFDALIRKHSQTPSWQILSSPHSSPLDPNETLAFVPKPG